MTYSMSIRGLQETQRDNLRRIAALKPGGAMEEGVRVGTLAAHRYAVSLTHVDTGALRASHRVQVRRTWGNRVEGEVYIDPAASRPGLIAARPAQYGFYEHARGGSHAFYERTVLEHGAHIAQQTMAVIAARLR